MRKITGAILILAAEQAFAHASLIGFPYQPFAREALIPASIVLGACGISFIAWGLYRDVP